MADWRDQEMAKLADAFARGELSRRRFLQRMSALGRAALLGGSFGSLLSTPTGRVEAASAPRYGGTLVAATIDKPVNMDPGFAELYSSMQVYQNIFNKLIYIDENYRFLPGLAKTWRQVDPTTWEFQLVDKAFFHNGAHCSARDVAFTFERLLDPKVGAAQGVFFREVAKVETHGDTRVIVKLKTPWGSFPYDLAGAFEVVNEQAIKTKDPRLDPVGTGPFKFVEWVKDDHITLQRWDKYHVKGRPYLDKVIFKAIQDDTVRLTGLETNEMQWVMQVPLQKVGELQQSKDIKVTPGKPYLPDRILFNCTKAPFNDKRVRQAIAWAVNRNEIVKVAFFGQAIAVAEAINPEHPLYSGVNVWKDGPNYDKAKALLNEAGVKGLKFSFDGQPQVPTQLRTAQVLKEQLKKIGVDMEIQNYESGEWIKRLIKKEYDVTSSYWSATIDPGDFYYPELYSKSPWNVLGYGTPEMDKSLEAFMTATALEARKAKYRALIMLIQQEVPHIVIDNQLQQYWVRANVYGMRPLPSMEIRMEPVYIG
jgi:peptide/nickel transport system substrate-binding protein